MKKTIKAEVSGKVQGVWFRASTKETADKLKLTGYAKNLTNGNVEIMATGEQDKIEILIAYLSSGPKLAVVKDLQWQWVYPEIFINFETL